MQTALRWRATALVHGLRAVLWLGRLAALVLCISAGLAGCASWQAVPKKTLAGAAVGGTAGGALAAAVGGKNPLLIAGASLAGILVGGAAGNLLDQKDTALQTAATQAFRSPPGTTVPWSNPRTGQQGTITSGVWGLEQGAACRRFTMQVFLDNRMQEVTGCAVPHGDGTWELR
jgi:surface antigen